MRDEVSRRAFALDSRTVWVEQQIVKDMIISSENASLGPGEYKPGLRPEMTRHISTPSLGRRSMADHFHPFRSSISRGGGSPTGKIRGGVMTPYSITAEGSMDSLGSLGARSSASRESATIFNDHDRRQPYRLRAETPGSYLGPEDILNPTHFDRGVTPVTSVTFPKAPLDICPITKAGPSYLYSVDPIKKSLQTPRIFPGERFSYNIKREQKVPRMEVEIPFSKPPITSFRSRLKDKHITVATPSSMVAQHQSERLEMQSRDQSMDQVQIQKQRQEQIIPEPSPIKKVKLSSRTSRYGGALKFDASSYNKYRKPPPETLSPSIITKRAGANLFQNILTVRRQPRVPSTRVGSLVSERVKKYNELYGDSVDPYTSKDMYGN